MPRTKRTIALSQTLRIESASDIILLDGAELSEDFTKNWLRLGTQEGYQI